MWIEEGKEISNICDSVRLCTKFCELKHACDIR